GVVEAGKGKECDDNFRPWCSWAKLLVRRCEDSLKICRHCCFLFFSVFGTLLSASLVSACVSLAFSLASSIATRSVSLFALHFSRTGIVSSVNFSRSSNESRTSSLLL